MREIIKLGGYHPHMRGIIETPCIDPSSSASAGMSILGVSLRGGNDGILGQSRRGRSTKRSSGHLKQDEAQEKLLRVRYFLNAVDEGRVTPDLELLKSRIYGLPHPLSLREGLE
jgi:hypothetical protein